MTIGNNTHRDDISIYYLMIQDLLLLAESDMVLRLLVNDYAI